MWTTSEFPAARACRFDSSRRIITYVFPDTPSSLPEAEKLLSQHQTIKEEIDNYRDEFAKMMEYGEKITAVSVATG